MNELSSLTPLDGRYRQQTKKLSAYFSEAALFRYRLLVEVEYLISLSQEKEINQIPLFDRQQQKILRQLYINFDLHQAQAIKNEESITNHDVKAVEYYLKKKIASTPLDKYGEFIHFGLTSEDVNNISYSLMLRDALKKQIIPHLEEIVKMLKTYASLYKDTSLLSLTHGQPATPTTVGKELAVFAYRLAQQLDIIKRTKINAKLNGASGNYAACFIAYPEVDWLNFSKQFITKLGLSFNPLTTQIENHDSCARLFYHLAGANNIIRDLNQDMWLYISRGIFKLKTKAGEIGSSTMPHKVNPINFENSEGNLGMANSLLKFMAGKLTISRLQRDLSDSTVIRNQGVALGYSLLAYTNTITGLNKIEINQTASQAELDHHWEVLAEAIQTILRKNGYDKPYEKLKELTRGEKINQADIYNFINNLDINQTEKNKLLALTPTNYNGLSARLAEYDWEELN